MRRPPLAFTVASAVAALIVAHPAAAQRPAKRAPAARTAPARRAPAPAPVTTPPAAPAPIDTALPIAPIGAATLVPTRVTTLRAAPDAAPLGTIAAGTTMTPLARERGWVRVRIEGWVPEREVVSADTALRSPLSAADIRADPAGTRGKVVRWEVEVLSLQKADPLRRDLAVDEPYLLARGPGRESAILYLAVPPSLVETARQLAARVLPRVSVTARVRNGRSDPVGVPILDVLAFGGQ